MAFFPLSDRTAPTKQAIRSNLVKAKHNQTGSRPYRSMPPGSAGTAAWPRRPRRGRWPTGPGATSARPRQEIGTCEQVCSGGEGETHRQNPINQTPARGRRARMHSKRTHHRKPPVRSAYVGGGGVLADAEERVVAARRCAAAAAAAGGIAGSPVHDVGSAGAAASETGDPRRRRGATQGEAAALQRHRIWKGGERWMDGFKEGRREKKFLFRGEGVSKISPLFFL